MRKFALPIMLIIVANTAYAQYGAAPYSQPSEQGISPPVYNNDDYNAQQLRQQQQIDDQQRQLDEMRAREQQSNPYYNNSVTR